MLDLNLADPETDVVELFKDFKKWYINSPHWMEWPNKIYSYSEFPRSALRGWLSFRSEQYLEETDQLILIWRKSGFIKQVDEIFKFTRKRLHA